MQHSPQPETKSLHDDYFVSQLVPEDHPLLEIDTAVDFEFVRGMVAHLYSLERGRQARDPALLLRLCFLQVYYNLSDREVMQRSQTDLACRCFLHLGLEDDLPHPSTLSVFRSRLGEDRFREIFNRSVKMAVEQGLVEGRLILVDSYGVVADVAIPQIRKLFMRLVRKGIQALEDFGIDTAWYRQQHDSLAADNSHLLTKQLREKDVQRWFELCELVREAVAEADVGEGDEATRMQVLELLEKGLNRHEGGSEQGGKLVSDVDPDARWSVRDRGKKLFAGYVEQIATDADSEIITAVAVTPANVDDKTQLVPLLDGHQKNTGDDPSAVGADSGYTGGGNRQDLARRGATDYVAVPTPKGHKQDKFSAVDFEPQFNDDAVPIKVRCPAGQLAQDGTWKEDKEGWSFYFKKAQCEGCPLRSRCSDAKYGRTVFISKYYRLYEQLRQRAETKEFERAQIERLGIERTFAYQQRRCGLHRTRYRGLDRVATQVFLACFMTNVVRITKRCREGPPRR